MSPDITELLLWKSQATPKIEWKRYNATLYEKNSDLATLNFDISSRKAKKKYPSKKAKKPNNKETFFCFLICNYRIATILRYINPDIWATEEITSARLYVWSWWQFLLIKTILILILNDIL